MKSLPPVLHLAPRRSPRALVLLVAAHAATAALLLALPVPLAAGLAGACAVALAGACSAARIAGRHRPALLHVGLDGRIAVTRDDGRGERGAILADSYVGRWLTTVVWRPDGRRRARTLLVVVDALPPDDFRRLRVALRYGRATDVAADTSGADAG